MKPTLMNKEEAIDFVLNRIQVLAPNVQYQAIPPKGKRKPDGLNYKLWFTGLKEENNLGHLEMYLGNVIENYERTGDINALIGFVNMQGELYKRFADLATNKVSRHSNTDNIIPVIRTTKFETPGEAKLIEDPLTGEYKVCYVEDNPEFVSLMMEENLPPGQTHDTIVDVAFDNLKRMGWVKQEHIHKGPGANLYIFENKTREFHAQFLIKEWTEAHLGKEFYAVFPSREVAVVMVPDNTSAMGFFGISGAVGALASIGNQMYHTLPQALSSAILHFKDGEPRDLLR